MKKTEATKNAIIASTIKLLRKNGNATIKEISDDAGVNIAAINYHFTDKETLLTVVIRRVLSDFKGRVDAFINTNPQTEEEIKKSIKNFFDEFYQFGLDNIGLIRFIIAPANQQLQEVCNKYFFGMFSVDSEFTYRILSRISAHSRTQATEDLKAKYMLLFSSLALPLLFQLDFFDRNGGKTMFPLQDASMKDKYIEQLTKIILG